MSARTLAANASWSLLSHALSRGSMLLSSIVLARSLGTVDFAAYSYFQMTVSMLAAYASLGLGVTASRYFAALGQEKSSNINKPLGMLWALSICTAIVGALTVLCLPQSWLGTGFYLPRWLLALGVFISACQVVPSGAILGLEKYKINIIVSFSSALTLFAGIAYAATRSSPIYGMLALIAAGCVQLLGETAIVIRAVKLRSLFNKQWFTLKAAKEVVHFAGPMLFVSLMAGSGSWFLGQIILHYQGATSFAIYAVGMQWFALALLLPGIVSRVTLPRVVRSLTDSEDERKLLVRKSAVLATAGAGCFAALGVIVGPAITNAYGLEFVESRWVIGGYFIAAIFSAPANTLGNAIIARDGQRIWFVLTATWLAALLGTGMIIKDLGVNSGSIAHAVASLLLTLLAAIAARVRKLI